MTTIRSMLTAVKPGVRQQFDYRGTRKYPPLKKREFNRSAASCPPCQRTSSRLFFQQIAGIRSRNDAVFRSKDLTRRFGVFLNVPTNGLRCRVKTEIRVEKENPDFTQARRDEFIKIAAGYEANSLSSKFILNFCVPTVS